MISTPTRLLASLHISVHQLIPSPTTASISLFPSLLYIPFSPILRFLKEKQDTDGEIYWQIGIGLDWVPNSITMDPCRFVRIVVGNLALKFPAVSSKPECLLPSDHSPYFCVIKLKNFPTQTATVPLLSPNHRLLPDSHLHAPSASFNLSHTDALKLAQFSPRVKVSVYSGRPGSTCGLLCSGKLLGQVSVPLDLKAAETKPCDFLKGWVSLGEGSHGAELYLRLRAEPDPRFVFRFGGEPECSPQVFQIQGNIEQPVFTCKFGFRSSIDRELTHSKSWLSSMAATEKEMKKKKAGKERKGWSVTVHDLSGSPVAAASMVTPFVPSPGSDRVSRANPGAWLILQPGNGAWKPWGRLEAWRERGDALGYRFHLLAAEGGGATGITLAESSLSAKNGGKFTIDDMATSSANSPFSSPSGSFDLGSGSWSGSGSGSGSGSWGHCMYKGFVMSAAVEGAGRCSRPEVEVGVEHVACTEDAAAFVALAAALDLSVDACRLFTQKLRKELRSQGQETVV